jgi:hypothetical protein
MDCYEVRVAGHLDRRRAHGLGCTHLHLLPSGDSQLTFTAADQAALYGFLTRLRDAGLRLVAVSTVLAPDARADTADAVPKEACHVAE